MHVAFLLPCIFFQMLGAHSSLYKAVKTVQAATYCAKDMIEIFKDVPTKNGTEALLCPCLDCILYNRLNGLELISFVGVLWHASPDGAVC